LLKQRSVFGAFLASEIARWTKVIKENKIAVAD
jgi:hypothetical protein